jgi:hypothetical protein
MHGGPKRRGEGVRNLYAQDRHADKVTQGGKMNFKDWSTTVPALVAAFFGFVAFSPETFSFAPWLVKLSGFIAAGGLALFGINAHSGKQPPEGGGSTGTLLKSAVLLFLSLGLVGCAGNQIASPSQIAAATLKESKPIAVQAFQKAGAMCNAGQISAADCQRLKQLYEDIPVAHKAAIDAVIAWQQAGQTSTEPPSVSATVDKFAQLYADFYVLAVRYKLIVPATGGTTK